MLESGEENFVINFQGSQFQAQQASINILMKSGLMGHFCTRNPFRNVMCLLKGKWTKLGLVRTCIIIVTGTSCTGHWHFKIGSRKNSKIL